MMTLEEGKLVGLGRARTGHPGALWGAAWVGGCSGGGMAWRDRGWLEADSSDRGQHCGAWRGSAGRTGHGASKRRGAGVQSRL